MNEIVRNSLKIVFNLTFVMLVCALLWALLSGLFFSKPQKKIYLYQDVNDYASILQLKPSDILADYEIGESKDYSLLRNKIFWHYIKPYFAKFSHDEFLSLWSVGYDLNDDNVNEILGVVDYPAVCGDEAKCLFVLKKEGADYKEIAYFTFKKDYGKIIVLKHKTNGFYDLYLFSTKENGDRILRYQKVY